MLCALIQADEGSTGHIFLSDGGQEGLRAIVDHFFETKAKELEASPYLAKNGKKWFNEYLSELMEEHDTILEMIKLHENWEPGRYIVKNVEPEWQEWTLVIR